MNNGEKEDITFKAAEVETWLKDKGAACSSIKLDKVNGIDMIATFYAQKPLSEIIGLLQERPDVAMQSTSNTKDGWLVHIKASARPQKVKVLFNLDWNDVIRQAMPTLSVIAMALFLILAANTFTQWDMAVPRPILLVCEVSLPLPLLGKKSDEHQPVSCKGGEHFRQNRARYQRDSAGYGKGIERQVSVAIGIPISTNAHNDLSRRKKGGYARQQQGHNIF